jgi:hypothetical protein
MPSRGEITGRKPRVSADYVKRKSSPPIPNPDAISDAVKALAAATDDAAKAAAQAKLDEVTADAGEINATPHTEPKAKRASKGTPIRGPPMALAYSIREFCEAHRISIDTYFRMQRLGLGPAIMKVGHRTLISAEAAAAWRRAREAAARRERDAAAESV